MQPELNQTETKPSRFAPLFAVTPLSRYLAIALMIILPFLGGWVGYYFAQDDNHIKSNLDVDNVVQSALNDRFPVDISVPDLVINGPIDCNNNHITDTLRNLLVGQQYGSFMYEGYFCDEMLEEYGQTIHLIFSGEAVISGQRIMSEASSGERVLVDDNSLAKLPEEVTNFFGNELRGDIVTAFTGDYEKNFIRKEPIYGAARVTDLEAIVFAYPTHGHVVLAEVDQIIIE